MYKCILNVCFQQGYIPKKCSPSLLRSPVKRGLTSLPTEHHNWVWPASNILRALISLQLHKAIYLAQESTVRQSAEQLTNFIPRCTEVFVQWNLSVSLSSIELLFSLYTYTPGRDLRLRKRGHNKSARGKDSTQSWILVSEYRLLCICFLPKHLHSTSHPVTSLLWEPHLGQVELGVLKEKSVHDGYCKEQLAACMHINTYITHTHRAKHTIMHSTDVHACTHTPSCAHAGSRKQLNLHMKEQHNV